jgi:hypothetical protein
MKILFISTISFLMIFIFFGCSSKDSASYHLLHELAKQKCSENPNPDERQQCIMKHSQPFNSNQYKNTNP